MEVIFFFGSLFLWLEKGRRETPHGGIWREDGDARCWDKNESSCGVSLSLASLSYRIAVLILVHSQPIGGQRE